VPKPTGPSWPSFPAGSRAATRCSSPAFDRLARSTRDLLNVIDAVTKPGAGLRSLKDTWADTTSPHGRLMLTVLGGLAEFERELIRPTGEGRKRAKERGVRFGRPRKRTPHQREEALRRLAAGETQADVARPITIDPTTIGRLQWLLSVQNQGGC